MNLREASRRLGGSPAGARTVTCPGPGHSRHDRSLSVTFDSNGDFIVFSHAGDDWQACRDHVRSLLGLRDWQPQERDERPATWTAPLPTAPGDDDRTRFALGVWKAARGIRGTLGERYLAARGLAVDDRAAEALRFHPAMKLDDMTAPGIVALFRDLRTDEPTGIHRTFLDAEGAKVGRKMLGRVAGAAVKLDPDETVTHGLVVGEGIETCLAARQMGYRPCWALGSVGAIERLPLLPGVDALTVLGEAGDGGANERAAKACARRWLAAGAEVSILDPVGGSDANDVLQRAAP